MSKFDITVFNAKVKEYFDLKQKNIPYERSKWSVNDVLAKKCKSILDAIAEQIEILIKEEILLDEFEVKVSEGVGYYPNSPWIAVLCKGETPSCGVYPVLGFYVENWYIGCVDSWQNPQKGFSHKFHYEKRKRFSQDELKVFDSSRIKYPAHIALMPRIFSWRDNISKKTLIKVLKNAINIYLDYKEYKKIFEKASDKKDQEFQSSKSKVYRIWELILPYITIIILAGLTCLFFTLDGCRCQHSVFIENKLMIEK